MSVEPRPLIRPLTSLKPDGTPYQRPAAIEQAIGDMLMLHRSEWISRAEETASEVLVYLIREVMTVDLVLAGHLIGELTKRIARVARKRIRLDEGEAEHVLFEIERMILQVVMDDTPDKDIVEVAFSQYVARRSIDFIRKHKRASFRRPESEEDELRLLERVPDGDPDALGILMEEERERLGPEWIRLAYAAIKDPRHLLATVLHYSHGVPVHSRDPGQPDLVTLFNESDWNIRYWLKKSLEKMRAAIGVAI
jgi:hypothetical protein